jgi:hypothetical protein
MDYRNQYELLKEQYRGGGGKIGRLTMSVKPFESTMSGIGLVLNSPLEMRCCYELLRLGIPFQKIEKRMFSEDAIIGYRKGIQLKVRGNIENKTFTFFDPETNTEYFSINYKLDMDQPDSLEGVRTDDQFILRQNEWAVTFTYKQELPPLDEGKVSEYLMSKDGKVVQLPNKTDLLDLRMVFDNNRTFSITGILE